jgi:hypothetical protein
MKTLSHLQNEAIERFEKEFCRETGLQDFPNFGETMVKEGIRASLVTDFLKTELTNIVKESFKNTRVEESYMRDVESSAYNTALLDIEAKQNQFLNN